MASKELLVVIYLGRAISPRGYFSRDPEASRQETRATDTWIREFINKRTSLAGCVCENSSFQLSLKEGCVNGASVKTMSRSIIYQ